MTTADLVLRSGDVLSIDASDMALFCIVSETFEPNILDLVDQRTRSHGGRWIPVVYDGRTVAVGPILGGTDGPCYLCLRHRVQQFSAEASSLPFPDPTGPGSKVTGLPASAALLAAGLVLALLEPRRAPTAVMFTFSDASLAVRRLPVTAAHACPRCRRGESSSGRGTNRLHEALRSAAPASRPAATDSGLGFGSVR